MQILSGSFLTWHDLQTHEKMHDAKERYVCRFCPSAFVEWGNLVEHENTHTGIKPFKCQSCPLTFFVFSTLRRHERTHENVKQIAKMSRETCPPGHASLSLQSVQERTHTEIQHQNYEECSSDKVMVDKQMGIYMRGGITRKQKLCTGVPSMKYIICHTVFFAKNCLFELLRLNTFPCKAP